MQRAEVILLDGNSQILFDREGDATAASLKSLTIRLVFHAALRATTASCQQPAADAKRIRSAELGGSPPRTISPPQKSLSAKLSGQPPPAISSPKFEGFDLLTLCQ